MITFQQALRLLEDGASVSRKGIVIKLSEGTAAVLATGLMGSIGAMVPLGDTVKTRGNWITLRIPLIHLTSLAEPWVSGKVKGYPYIFTDEDIAATDWELVP